MMHNVIEEIKSLGEVSNISIDDYTISIYAKINFYTRKDIRIIFDDFDINDCREQQFIIDNIDFILHNIELIQDKMCDSIIEYISKEYNKIITIEAFEKHEIELINIFFTPDEPFGNCSIRFHSKFEIEHGLGILLERWRVKEVGWADIR
jgi:hypothetical protein